MMNLSRTSKVPLYQQLYEILSANLRYGVWRPGDLIPSEVELIEQYQVSRITVRQVLEMLVNDGLIYRQRGRGTFVAFSKIEQALVRIVSFTEDMLQRGFVPSTKTLSSGLVPAPREIAGKLSLAKGEQMVRLERLRLADGEPMSIEESFWVHRYCPGILDHDITSQSLRKLIDNNYGIRWLHAKQVIQAINAPAEIAAQLEIKARSALLYVERISYSQDEIPIELLRIYHRGDRYRFYNDLRG
jgi:GntR family transcriptional regulator